MRHVTAAEKLAVFMWRISALIQEGIQMEEAKLSNYDATKLVLVFREKPQFHMWVELAKYAMKTYGLEHHCTKPKIRVRKPAKSSA